MIIKEKPIEIEIRGEIEKFPYLIKAHRESFRTLFSTLYTNKIASIIRELSTNAYDSHVQAGKLTEPFQVHLPNKLEPWFAVKDNGVGLNHEQVTGIYRTFFDSNKTREANTVGALGLGSKSPFSYVDQYSLEANFGGVKRVYNSFIDADGIPSLAKLTEGETTEPNGVEVKFAVKEADFQKFYADAVQILQWFKVRPNVVGYSSFAYPNHKYMFKGEGYEVYEQSTHKSNLIMGNISYPCTISWNSPFDAREKHILHWGVNIYLEIGDLEITANRESVNLDGNPEGVKKIQAILKKVVEDTKGIAQKEVDKAKTKWEARISIFKNSNSFLYNLHGRDNLTYNGQNLSINLDRPEKVIFYHLSFYGKNIKKRDVEKLTANSYPIYFDDLPHGGLIRINNEVRKKRQGDAYSIRNVSEQWLKDEGLDTVVIRSSSLPKVVYDRKPGVSYKKEYSQVYEYTGARTPSYACWKDAQVDLNEGGTYVEILRYMIQEGSVSHSPEDIRYEFELLTNYGRKIYGIRPNDADKIKRKYKGWIPLKDYMKSLYTQNVIDKMILRNKWQSFNYDYDMQKFEDEMFNINSTFGKLLIECTEAKKVCQDIYISRLYNISHKYGIKIPEDSGILNVKYNELSKTYNLWPCFNLHSDKIKLVADYIREIDTKIGKINNMIIPDNRLDGVLSEV